MLCIRVLIASMPALMCKQDCCLARGLQCFQHPTTSVSHGSCQVYPKLVPTLRQYFGYEEFRPGQIDAILAVLHGHDVFVRMATGSGKSMCMYLPPLVSSKAAVAIIISPLVGLMEEQVSHVRLDLGGGGGGYWTLLKMYA